MTHTNHNKKHQITINLSITDQTLKKAVLVLIGFLALYRICTSVIAFPLSTIDEKRAISFLLDLLASFSFMAVSAYFLSGTRLGTLLKTTVIAGEALLVGARYGYLYLANLDEMRLWSITDPPAIVSVIYLVYFVYAVLLFVFALPILRKKRIDESDQA